MKKDESVGTGIRAACLRTACANAVHCASVEGKWRSSSVEKLGTSLQ